jgi:hypothetical protein
VEKTDGKNEKAAPAMGWSRQFGEHGRNKFTAKIQGRFLQVCFYRYLVTPE